MTVKKFFGFFFLQWLALAFTKVWLLNGEVFSNPTVQHFVYYGIIALLTIALFRRFGVITYIETVFALIFWFFGSLFLDLIITTNYTSIKIFANTTYWAGYVAMILAAIIFHKKRHIQIRKELHAHHHAHHGGHKAHGDHHQQPHGQHAPGKQH